MSFRFASFLFPPVAIFACSSTSSSSPKGSDTPCGRYFECAHELRAALRRGDGLGCAQGFAGGVDQKCAKHDFVDLGAARESVCVGYDVEVTSGGVDNTTSVKQTQGKCVAPLADGARLQRGRPNPEMQRLRRSHGGHVPSPEPEPAQVTL